MIRILICVACGVPCFFLSAYCFGRTSKLDDFDPRSAFGERSVFKFFVAHDRKAWLIALTSAVFQMMTLLIFLPAANIKRKITDGVFTLSCPVHSMSCVDGKTTSWYGYFLYGTILVVWLLADVMGSFKLIACSFKREDPDTCFGGTIVFFLKCATAIVSAVYALAISTSNTEMIVNAVILLFVTDLDEKTHTFLNALNPEWARTCGACDSSGVLREATRTMSCTGIGSLTGLVVKLSDRMIPSSNSLRSLFLVNSTRSANEKQIDDGVDVALGTVREEEDSVSKDSTAPSCEEGR